ncbi:hypothetical protein H4R19_002829, partial [Coemansia spiralis]
HLLPGHSYQRRLWTADESSALFRLVGEKASSDSWYRGIDWDAMAKKIGSRNARDIRAKFAYHLACHRTGSGEGEFGTHHEAPGERPAHARKGARWIADEDDALRTAVAVYGPRQWRLVADFVGTRTSVQCMTRWRHIRTPVSGARMPPHHWARIHDYGSPIDQLAKPRGARSPPNRQLLIESILTQQRNEVLQDAAQGGSLAGGPELATVDGRPVAAPYSAEEDARIVRLVRLLGTRWKLVAQLLNEANQNSVHACAGGEAGPAVAMEKRQPASVLARYMCLVRRQHPPPPGPPESPRRRGRWLAGTVPRAWTPDEDRQLERAIDTVINGNGRRISWPEIERLMHGTGRTRLMCRNRWAERIGNHLSRAPYTLAEDKQLWPFVTGIGMTGRRAPAGYHRYAVTSNYSSDDNSMAHVGLGWMAANMRGRSTDMLRQRILRLRQTIDWLRAVIKVENPQDHVELVHRFTNAPLRLATRGQTKTTTD